MELPHLGKHCALSQCNRLDFLPILCSACRETFCMEHYKFSTHNCAKAKEYDKQVPVCPLCSQPVTGTRPNEPPDIVVSHHIDKFCKANESIKNNLLKPKTNLQACEFRSCKQRDLIYLECSDCLSKFCIKHRHPTDHSCPGPSILKHNLAANWNSFKSSCSTSASSGFELFKNKSQQIGKSGQAVLNKLTTNKSHQLQSTSRAPIANLQGNISEQDALAIALQESTKNHTNGRQLNQEDEDLALARALQQSEIEARNRATGNNRSKDTCVLS